MDGMHCPPCTQCRAQRKARCTRYKFFCLEKVVTAQMRMCKYTLKWNVYIDSHSQEVLHVTYFKPV